MARFLAGVVLGAALLAGGVWAWTRKDGGCLGRCGDGTRCAEHRCVASINDAPRPAAPAKEPRHRRRHDGNSPSAPEIKLQPGDEKMTAQGDALGRPEKIDLSQPDERELSQDDLDRVFLPAQPRIEHCITDALGDAPLETGRVEVGLRVEKSGDVRRVRVEAPQLLQRQGLTRCVRAVATSLRFPASGGASVVTYPFELK
ncbi:MAG TPA: AgmX/PglI C-terminal domain-containing protein [Polyangia bacterium]|nr:AgmX/PglI C-terminal domain-containing protein [Polyangia bacterium]